jgi:hypothetical protein
MEKILARCITDVNGCWIWQGAKDSSGYGNVWWEGKNVGTHRAMYGEIPNGLEIDHTCRNRACCNPAHLEAVTHVENVRRGKRGELTTHCPQGHEYTDVNTYIRSGKYEHRVCRTCRRDKVRAYRERKAQELQ